MSAKFVVYYRVESRQCYGQTVFRCVSCLRRCLLQLFKLSYRLASVRSGGATSKGEDSIFSSECESSCYEMYGGIVKNVSWC